LSLQDVEKKVMASADQEARQLVEKAQAEAKAELQRRGDALRDDQRRRVQAAKGDADAALERDVSSRRAEHRMRILQAKNDILDAIFDQARQRALASEGFDYGRWLATQVRLACAKASGTIHCNERDRATVEAVIRESGAERASVAPATADIQGGVIMVCESFDLDLTLEATLADLRTELTVSLAERLFADLPTMGEHKES
jgi:vacuolar-type H+-ATPase subunit E/Vma4